MSVKFTTPTSGADTKLLFEFLDIELPEYIDYEYVTKLGKSIYINNIQTNQIKGTYLQPIQFEAEFVGTYWSNDEGKQITANQRADQFSRLQGRVLKFFFDNFKQLVIIEKFKKRVYNQERVEVTCELQPHDIIGIITPTEAKQIIANTVELLGGTLDSETVKDVDKNLMVNALNKSAELAKQQAQTAKSKRENYTNDVNKISNNIHEIVHQGRLNDEEVKSLTVIETRATIVEKAYANAIGKSVDGKDDLSQNLFKKLQDIENDANAINAAILKRKNNINERKINNNSATKSIGNLGF